jgi:hypothetical protein
MQKIKLVSLFAAVIIGMAFFIPAQAAKTAPLTAPQNAVNMSEAKIAHQENNNLWIEFKLTNQGIIQAGVQATVNLTGKDNAQQTFTSADSFDLAENQTVQKQFKYSAPQELVGDFQMSLTLKNQDGIILSMANLGKVSLMGTLDRISNQAQSQSQPQPQILEQKQNNPLSMAIILIVVLLVISLIVTLIKRRKGMSVIAVLIIAGGMLFAGSEKSMATSTLLCDSVYLNYTAPMSYCPSALANYFFTSLSTTSSHAVDGVWATVSLGSGSVTSVDVGLSEDYSSWPYPDPWTSGATYASAVFGAHNGTLSWNGSCVGSTALPYTVLTPVAGVVAVNLPTKAQFDANFHPKTCKKWDEITNWWSFCDFEPYKSDPAQCKTETVTSSAYKCTFRQTPIWGGGQCDENTNCLGNGVCKFTANGYGCYNNADITGTGDSIATCTVGGTVNTSVTKNYECAIPIAASYTGAPAALCASGSVANLNSNGTWSCVGTCSTPASVPGKVVNSCAAVPANGVYYTGVNITGILVASQPAVYSTTDTAAKCEYKCNSASIWNAISKTCDLVGACGTNANGGSAYAASATQPANWATGYCNNGIVPSATPAFPGQGSVTNNWNCGATSCNASRASACSSNNCAAATCIGQTCVDCSVTKNGTKDCRDLNWREVSPN